MVQVGSVAARHAADIRRAREAAHDVEAQGQARAVKRLAVMLRMRELCAEVAPEAGGGDGPTVTVRLGALLFAEAYAAVFQTMDVAGWRVRPRTAARHGQTRDELLLEHPASGARCVFIIHKPAAPAAWADL